MTNKEAINLLDNLIGMIEDNQNSDYDTALKMAIEALKQPEQMPLPGIFIAEKYDTVEDESGNRGFGVYIPSEKQIYVAGNVPEEIKLKALFHEIAHWAQDISGREFNEDEAERFSNSVYNALPFTSLREPRKILFGSCLEYSGTSNLPSTQPERANGKWINDGDPATWVCSNCGYRVKGYNNTKFCPNCGCEMER